MSCITLCIMLYVSSNCSHRDHCYLFAFIHNVLCIPYIVYNMEISALVPNVSYWFSICNKLGKCIEDVNAFTCSYSCEYLFMEHNLSNRFHIVPSFLRIFSSTILKWMPRVYTIIIWDMQSTHIFLMQISRFTYS